MIRFLAILVLLIVSATSARAYDDASWVQFLKQVEREAVAQGVNQQVARRALETAEFDPSVIAKDRKQPEKTMTFKTYKKNVITQNRINEGRALARQHASLLSRIEDRFGVPRQYVVALWGMESSFGKIQGKHELVTALASLAYEGRRRSFFKKELINTLKLIDQQGFDAHQVIGSWAGAMGMVQFMPSSYLAYAADGDGDGQADIWRSPADALASAANYLAKNGWNYDLRWGRPVILPSSFPHSLTGRNNRHSLATFAAAGVKTADGSPLPADNIRASIVVPDGMAGPAFVVYDNYHVIMDWNRSDYFATSVGLLADAIAQ